MKPILFNTDMVIALLLNRKTETRRVVKHTVNDVYGAACANGLWNETYDSQNLPESLVEWYVKNIAKPPYKPGDILYVREAWSKKESSQCLGITTGECPHKSCETADGACFGYDYIYKATDSLPYFEKWRPSIHMPKDAARIFLRVTGVRVERLQDIDGHGVLAEGILNGSSNPKMGKRWENMQRLSFSEAWWKTLKPADRNRYDWVANPWVWVIEFEQISKEEAGL